MSIAEENSGAGSGGQVPGARVLLTGINRNTEVAVKALGGNGDGVIRWRRE